jgi:hypothetical protein
MASKEMEVNRDIHNIIYCLTSPPPKDESDEEYERILAWSSALSGWEHKYGDDFVADLSDRINDLVCEFCDRAFHESEV